MVPRLPARLLRARWAVVAVPAVIVALGASTAIALDQGMRDRAEDRRSERLDAVTTALNRRLDAYAELLYGVRGLFDAVGARPTRLLFRRHVAAQEVGRRLPGVRVVGFAERVARRDLPAFTARVNRDAAAPGLGYPRFAPYPASARSELVVIDYVEPQRGNERAFGLDLLSEPVRRAAMQRTRRTGRPAATAPVTLVQETGRQRGFLVMLAVPGDAPLFHGTAYAAFRMGDLIDGAVGPRLADADLEIRDGPVLAADTRPGQDARAGDVRRMAVFGRPWSLAYNPDDEALSAAEQAVPWVVGAGALLLALVVAQLLRAQAATERRARALAERMTADLAASNAELERFAYIASHDLQEPLRAVTGFVGLLRRQYADRLDDRGRGYLSHVERGAGRMRALIVDLLEYSRADASPVAPCDLEPAWEQAVTNLRAPIEAAQARVSAGPLPVVMADSPRMVQVFEQLLANAIAYRGDAPPEIRAEARRDGTAWEVSVRDNGRGIDPRYHERVFELFERLEARGEADGTGMGLSICRKAIERFGGRMWVESAPGAGSTFRFTLPAA